MGAVGGERDELWWPGGDRNGRGHLVQHHVQHADIAGVAVGDIGITPVGCHFHVTRCHPTSDRARHRRHRDTGRDLHPRGRRGRFHIRRARPTGITTRADEQHTTRHQHSHHHTHHNHHQATTPTTRLGGRCGGHDRSRRLGRPLRRMLLRGRRRLLRCRLLLRGRRLRLLCRPRVGLCGSWRCRLCLCLCLGLCRLRLSWGRGRRCNELSRGWSGAVRRRGQQRRDDGLVTTLLPPLGRTRRLRSLRRGGATAVMSLTAARAASASALAVG